MSRLIVIRSRPATYRCEVCGTPLHDDEVNRHMAACVRRNFEAIVGQSPAAQLPGFFGPESGDVEFERWVRERREPLIEGRMRM